MRAGASSCDRFVVGGSAWISGARTTCAVHRAAHVGERRLSSRDSCNSRRNETCMGRRPTSAVMRRYGDTEAIEDFLAIGKDVNAGDDQGRTALHYAVAYQQEKVWFRARFWGLCEGQSF